MDKISETKEQWLRSFRDGLLKGLVPYMHAERVAYARYSNELSSEEITAHYTRTKQVRMKWFKHFFPDLFQHGVANTQTHTHITASTSASAPASASQQLQQHISQTFHKTLAHLHKQHPSSSSAASATNITSATTAATTASGGSLSSAPIIDIDELSPLAVPNIAICASGGGYRAMVATLGGLMELEKSNLLHLISHISGLSGSTWCMANWYGQGKMDTQVDPHDVEQEEEKKKKEQKEEIVTEHNNNNNNNINTEQAPSVGEVGYLEKIRNRLMDKMAKPFYTTKLWPNTIKSLMKER